MQFIIAQQWSTASPDSSFVKQKAKKMAAQKTIAIVGATGKAGTAITHKLAKHDYRILLISRDINKLMLLENEVKKTAVNAEVETIECLKDGCWEADIIVLAVPTTAENEVAKKINEVATQKVVVRILTSVTNTCLPHANLAALQISLPYSQIVNVVINPGTLPHITITGSNEEAVQLITDIASAIGFKTKALQTK